MTAIEYGVALAHQYLPCGPTYQIQKMLMKSIQEFFPMPSEEAHKIVANAWGAAVTEYILAQKRKPK